MAQPGGEQKPLETHYEHALDDEPAPTREPVYVDVVARDDERRPVVPAALRKGNRAQTARWAAGNLGHRAAYHGVRLPLYIPLALFWAVVGVFRLAGAQLRWWWVAEQTSLRQEAANTNDAMLWMKIHDKQRAVRLVRFAVLAAETVVIAIGVTLLVTLAPWWAVVAAVAVTVPALAHAGRPATQPIVRPAIVTPRFRKLTADIVLRAYYAAGLGHPDKPDQQVTFGSPMARDGGGSRVLVDLPYGKGLDDAVRSAGAIASGLDVSRSQLYLSRDPSSHRRHVLWVADQDPLAIPAGRTPLLKCQPTDIWQPAPLGLDERGRKVAVPLMWNSALVAAVPRAGKTFSARLLALYGACDPYCQLTVFDGKGSPDWRRFALVAERYGFGLMMARDGDPVDLLVDTLHDLKRDVQDRYRRLSDLPASVCPEGKLTRQIARDPQYRMPVRLVVLDEVQEYFDLGEVSKEIASLLVYLVKVAPGAGVIVLSATQRPSGIGTGHVKDQFIAFRDNHQVRFGLRTGSWQVSELCLGAGAYGEGYDTSTLLPEYKGVGILRGAAEATPTVRSYLADGQDAEKILLYARGLRERAGTLTGMAAGEDASRQVRDVLRDVDSVFYAGEAWISWQRLAQRLAEALPEAYADTTPEAISAQVRGLGVESKNGKQDGQVLKGAHREQVQQAIKRREIEGGA